MAKAQATILRYPKTYPRPLGAIHDGISSEEGIEPPAPPNRSGTRRITLMYFGRISGPLANSYQMELGPPLRLTINSSPETSCSLPTEGSMALSPTSSLWKGDEEAYH
jgi:hypothetical protein